MTPRKEKLKCHFVRQWLNKAEEDYSLAKHLVEEDASFYSAISFHAQQAAEKYLKAFLVDRQIEFPKTHDLAGLLDLVSVGDKELADSLREIVVLTSYGVDARYPTDLPSISCEEAGRAVELATKVSTAIVLAISGTAKHKSVRESPAPAYRTKRARPGAKGRAGRR